MEYFYLSLFIIVGLVVGWLVSRSSMKLECWKCPVCGRHNLVKKAKILPECELCGEPMAHHQKKEMIESEDFYRQPPVLESNKEEWRKKRLAGVKAADQDSTSVS